MVHGLGAHTGRWEFLGDFFQKNNISSYGLELKGFGQTRGERGHIDSLDTYFRDIRSLYDIIKRKTRIKNISPGREYGGVDLFSLCGFGAAAFFRLNLHQPGLCQQTAF